MADYFVIMARLSDGQSWGEVRSAGEFKTEAEARDYLQRTYPNILQGEHIRPDVFHGLQPVRVFGVNRRKAASC